MGVFGALNAAVSGLSAQAYALENISGNIANASTVGYKRLDTSFSDLVGGGRGAQPGQLAGTVSASSRATNGIQGDLQQSQVNTYMGINGSGYFVVQGKAGEVDGRSIFSGDDLYTRRGDFDLDKEGRLVNGAGYYLMGQPIDPVTKNVSGSVPSIITVDTSVIPAVLTDRIQYEGNLPTTPQTSAKLAGGDDLLDSALTKASTGAVPDGAAAGHTVGVDAISADDEVAFLNSSIAGEAITVYNSSGTPVNVQMRWAKTFEDDGSQPDTWSLYYLSDSDATGANPKWTKVSDAQFDSSAANGGKMTVPANDQMAITGLTVDGETVGDVSLDFGTNALTQFSDSNGRAKISKLTQNGYPSGDLTGVSVSEAGRLVASYSNGRTRELYDISLVSFSGEAWLERVDGGAYEVTPESGEPIAGAQGRIVGKRLEASNTDIADEFSKLIVTQQAYSANTRIVNTGDQMLKEAINMIR
ncbi:flagellar hook protein FlgE [Stappia indica]|uniref:flagellar hook protein FlgE n=1 Tax=Stappia indica TaxID=538381 RepID=UPI001CD1B140|nr:flagellar hook-basal body complex protein [Stappia indica]MCA1298848.1 flagellar hook-basal body complex protein [Stappia indica]